MPTSERDPMADDAPPKAYRPTHLKNLTRTIIKSRADRLRIETQRKRARLEVKTTNAIKHVVGEYKVKTEAIIDDAFAGGIVSLPAGYEAARKVHALRAPLGADLLGAVEPAQREAAAIGVASVQALVDGKALDYDIRRKAGSFPPNTADVIRRRGRYISQNIPQDEITRVNEAILDAVAAAIEEGESVGFVQAAVKDIFNTLGNQAERIARTEVGTLYSTARNDEMKDQGFTSHEWLASLDEATRELHAASDGEVRRIGERFPCGLEYPLQDGGDPGNVINCRCETIPVVED